MDDGNLLGKIFQAHIGNIAVPQQDFPFVRPEVLCHEIEQGAFAAAVGPDEGGDFPFVQLLSLIHI